MNQTPTPKQLRDLADEVDRIYAEMLIRDRLDQHGTVAFRDFLEAARQNKIKRHLMMQAMSRFELDHDGRGANWWRKESAR